MRLGQGVVLVRVLPQVALGRAGAVGDGAAVGEAALPAVVAREHRVDAALVVLGAQGGGALTGTDLHGVSGVAAVVARAGDGRAVEQHPAGEAPRPGVEDGEVPADLLPGRAVGVGGPTEANAAVEVLHGGAAEEGVDRVTVQRGGREGARAGGDVDDLLRRALSGVVPRPAVAAATDQDPATAVEIGRAHV